MQLSINLSDFSVAPAQFVVKKGDKFPVEVAFLQGGKVVELPNRTDGRLVLTTGLSSDFLIRSAWRKVGRAENTRYLINLDLAGVELEDLFASLSGELASVKLVAELEWERGPSRASSKSMVVTVENDYSRRDEVIPTIQLQGANPMTVAHGVRFLDPGATVSDDNDMSRVVYGRGAVNTGALGNYNLTYFAKDASGNEAAPVTRQIIVVDMTPPVIYLIGAAAMTVFKNKPFIDPGATVADNVDINRKIYGTGTVDNTAVGVYSLIYNATDAVGNIASTVTRSVTVVEDTVKPLLELIGPQNYTISSGVNFVDLGARVTDNADGASVIMGVGVVDVNTVGNYLLTYTSTDAAGNVSANLYRYITVVLDTVRPVITLLGENPLVLTVGPDLYSDPGAMVVDDVGGTSTISGVGVVSTVAAGVYAVVYNATDAAGNAAIPVYRQVIVGYNFGT